LLGKSRYDPGRVTLASTLDITCVWKIDGNLRVSSETHVPLSFFVRQTGLGLLCIVLYWFEAAPPAAHAMVEKIQFQKS
jgi:hypothetical protein